jgi:hypothetical protein
MELRVEVTKMATSIDYFFKVRFDINEVRLVEEYATTAAGCSALGALEVFAFGFQSFLGVKSLYSRMTFIPLNQPGMLAVLSLTLWLRSIEMSNRVLGSLSFYRHLGHRGCAFDGLLHCQK